MIDLYTARTQNGRKASILLEELALPYTAHRIDIDKGEQHRPEFLAVSPNNKIPAIVDRDAGVSVFESAAILIYLGEKTGSALLPSSGAPRARTLEWLLFQAASSGPMFGQLGFFARAAEKNAGAIKRYADEATRLLGVMERRLGEADYFAGDYSIADIAAYPWAVAIKVGYFRDAHAGLAECPNVNAWMDRVGARSAVERGMTVPA